MLQLVAYKRLKQRQILKSDAPKSGRVRLSEVVVCERFTLY